MHFIRIRMSMDKVSYTYAEIELKFFGLKTEARDFLAHIHRTFNSSWLELCNQHFVMPQRA